MLHEDIGESIHFNYCKKHIKMGVSFLIYREAGAFFTWIVVYITGTGLPQGKLFPFLQLCLRLCCRRMRISWACFSFVLVGKLCRLYVGAWNRKRTQLILFALAMLITLRSLVDHRAKGTPAPARPPTHHSSLLSCGKTQPHTNLAPAEQDGRKHKHSCKSQTSRTTFWCHFW